MEVWGLGPVVADAIMCDFMCIFRWPVLKILQITLAPIVLLLSTAVHVVKLAGYLRWRSGDRIQLWHQRAPGRKWEGCTTPGREKGGSMYRPQGHTTAQVSEPGLLLQRDCKIAAENATSIPRSSLEVNLPVFHTILYG